MIRRCYQDPPYHFLRSNFKNEKKKIFCFDLCLLMNECLRVMFSKIIDQQKNNTRYSFCSLNRIILELLQWIGETGLREAAEGRVVTAKLVCRDASQKSKLPGVFTPCVAFRVAGSQSKSSRYSCLLSRVIFSFRFIFYAYFFCFYQYIFQNCRDRIKDVRDHFLPTFDSFQTFEK